MPPEKYTPLLLRIELFIKIAKQAQLDDICKELLIQRRSLEALNNLNDSLDIQHEQIEKDTHNLLIQICDADDNHAQAIYAGLILQLHEAIIEGALLKVSSLLENCACLFGTPLNLNQTDTTFGTFLSSAIQHNQLEIAKLLMSQGASPNYSPWKHLPPLHIAIKNQNPAAVELLLTHNAKIDDAAFYKAIQRGNRTIVKLLLAQGVSLKSTKNGIIYGDTINFKSPLQHALCHDQIEVAQLLFSEIKKDAALLQDALNHFINYAPLELLQEFLEDNSLSISEKLASNVPTRILPKNLVISKLSSEILVHRLLRDGSDAPKRLTVLKLLAQQLMKLEFATININKEACYEDRELLKKLSQEAASSPIKDLAQRLLDSLEASSKQGVVAVGYRLLYESACFALNNQCSFSSGVLFLENVLKALNGKQKELPDVDTAIQLIDDEAMKISASSLTMKTSEETVRSSVPDINAVRFRAMAGSSIFSKFNPDLPAGGKSDEAAQWYRSILSTVVATLRRFDMLKDNWDEEKLYRLLDEITQRPEFSEPRKPLKREATGFYLPMPEHFIPAVFYKDDENWRYTVMCRAYLQPLMPETKAGAIDFVISAESKAEICLQLVQETIKNETSSAGLTLAAMDREIKHKLLTHFIEMEQLTGARCVYSDRCNQKTYKGPTCFASNLRPLLKLLLDILPKNNTTDTQWQQFNNAMKESIYKEMDKADFLTEKNQHTADAGKATLPKKQTAYKLSTTLLRWMEINQFQPVEKAEIEGKEATVAHVLEHTKAYLSSF